MHVWPDSPVITADEVHVGTCRAVVIHPSSWKTLAVIVRRPRFGRRDTCVPAAMVDRATPAGLWLKVTKGEFERVPKSAAPYQRPPKDWLTPLDWPADRVYWPAGYDGPVYPQLRAGDMKHWGTVRTPVLSDESAPADGPAVTSQDGYKVGDRARILQDGSAPEQLVFQSNGVLWPAGQVQLPAYWVSTHDAWNVSLAMDTETIGRLIHKDQASVDDEAAGDRLEQELAREQRGESLMDVDPYDVLARPSMSGFKTTYERDDASDINPQPHPDEQQPCRDAGQG